ncbi:MAG TPA: tail fiber protein [Bryobacteraceae bacterium]|nr:tail fiber protein [Bryobacteraceae bacterium]
MSEPFLGQISIFSFNFPPRGWAFCDGQLLAINQNQALFSLLGTYYGGNGTTTFALPNLQTKVAMGVGNGAGLSPRVIGQTGGEQGHTLSVNEMPQHSHTPNYTASANSLNPAGDLWAADPNGNITFATSANETMAIQITNSSGNVVSAGAIANAGGGQAHNNMAPYLVLTFAIALQGIFPSRS